MRKFIILFGIVAVLSLILINAQEKECPEINLDECTNELTSILKSANFALQEELDAKDAEIYSLRFYKNSSIVAYLFAITVLAWHIYSTKVKNKKYGKEKTIKKEKI